jgi:hypothetical protein
MIYESWVASRDERKQNKKEEFSSIMRCMGPENSFPQICVVSVNEFALITKWVQEYEGPQHFSNLP